MQPDAIRQAERVLGRTAESWSPIVGRGYSIAERWIVRMADGTSVFVKHAVDEQTAEALRAEHRVYATVKGSFLPCLLGWEDEGMLPVLVLEDLSAGATWPPPWSAPSVAAVVSTLAELAADRPPEGLVRLEDDQTPGWPEVAADPDPFLQLNLCSYQWLETVLPTLLSASATTPLKGEALLHCDVRSDNVCIREGRAVLFDWNHAVVGNPLFDIAFWLPSLALEGGPAPQQIAADHAGVETFSAFVAGFFAALAGLPPPDGAPTVRSFQLAQLRIALPWATETLELPPLDGPQVNR